jgi:hypothetical protein
MKRSSILACALAWALMAGCASAQQAMIPPGATPFDPPPLPPLPPPKIEVPVVPKMDQLPPGPNVVVGPRESFSDRVSRCLDQGAAAGLDPNARATYSRSCANR